ncbi:MAG: TIM barrel protein [bacterium]
MEIFPKIDEKLKGIEYLHEYIKEAKGIEIQMLEMDYNTLEMNAYDPIKKILEIHTFEEITVHTPIPFCDIEFYMFSSEEKFHNLLKYFMKISREFNVHINVLFHTSWDYKKHVIMTLDYFQRMLDLIKGSNVTILLENTFFINEDACTEILLCEHIDNDQLKICIDTCHVKIRAAIYKRNYPEYFEEYIAVGNMQKYIKQFHFSNNGNNDGYINKETHSNAHELDENFMEDINILIKNGLINKNFVTEINDDDYDYRINQKQEIDLLKQVKNKL